MKLLVCGGRKYADQAKAFLMLDTLEQRLHGIDCLIQGGATGADALGKAWAKKKGICCITVEANWDYYRNAAGPIRNGWMLRHCSPSAVCAFPGGVGTGNMVEQARLAGVTVFEFYD